jgi:O-antigen ligase
VYDRNFLNVYQAVFQGWSRPGHSIIVGSLVELGIVGLVLILVAWFTTFRELRSVPAQSTLFPVRIALEATLLALFFESLTIDTLYLKFYWLAFSLVMLVAGVARNEQNQDLRRNREANFGALPESVQTHP